MQRLAALVPRSTVASDPLPWRARTQREAPSRDHSARAAHSTAPIARAIIRPMPNGLLIPGRDPLPSGSTPCADILLWPTLAREAKTPWIRAPRTDESPEKSPILDRRLAYLTTHRSISYSSSRRKRRTVARSRREWARSASVLRHRPVCHEAVANRWRMLVLRRAWPMILRRYG
jgi:hypothetical protein